MTSSYRNISFASVGILSDLMVRGADVIGRGSARTKELLHQVNTLEAPAERFLFVPSRGNDLFAQIAEAIWVIAGRNDIGWLSRYLRRARDYSDDGVIWRAAYGPRLRRWHGTIDQLAEARRLLLDDQSTRRAVMTLFDPEHDYAESKDIPCNNWLSWIIRDGRLHLNIALRSNDAVWGFSGANAFEWSVLHEMIAYWTRTSIGQEIFFATSLHVYERHYDLTRKVVAGFHRRSPYNYGVPRAHFNTEFDHLDASLKQWFDLENEVRNNPNAPVEENALPVDPFMANCLRIIRLKWGRTHWDDTRLAAEMAKLPETDALAAAYEYFGRSTPSLLENIPHPHIAAFFTACKMGSHTADQDFLAAIASLHSRKDRAYGAAWKKRGERISILPNIARKVDRLETFANAGTMLLDETLLDTVIDLFVYVSKYRLFLEDLGKASSFFSVDAPKPYADHESNFRLLISIISNMRSSVGRLPLVDGIQEVVLQFANLWPQIEANAPLDERADLADKLSVAIWHLLETIRVSTPREIEEFILRETSMNEVAK